MITTNVINDRIEVTNSGSFSIVQVRKATIIMNNGQEVGRTFHRYTVAPTDTLSELDQDVQLICTPLFTEAMKAAYTSHLNSLEV